MRIRSTSFRKSISNHDTNRTSDYQYLSSNQLPYPSPTASVYSNSTQSPLTPAQSYFPTSNSELLNHQHDARKIPPWVTFPFSESKSTHSGSIGRIRNRLSSSGNNPLKLHHIPPQNHQNKPIKPAPQIQVPFPPSDHSRLKRVAHPESSNVLPRPIIEPLSKTCQHVSKSNRLQPFYGVVKHTFKAEHRYELNVQAGESILINAYNDRGWLICKPISRLGGAGLVPITHVQICDMISGRQFSSEGMYQFLRSSGLPKVEEWEQAAAAYRCNSIPLGSLESLSLSALPESFATNTTPKIPKSCTQLDSTAKPAKQNVASSQLILEWQQQQLEEDSGVHVSDGAKGSSNVSVDQLGARHSTFIRATAESFYEEDGRLLFLIKVQLSSPAGSEQKTRTYIIHRKYKDLLEFDASFRSHLRTISSTVAEKVDLPNLLDQGSVNEISQRPWFDQLENLKCYLSQLSRASPGVRGLREISDFLAPREACLDFEIPTKLDCDDEEATQHFDEKPTLIPPGEYFNFDASIRNRPRLSTFDQVNSSPLASDPGQGSRSSGPISDDSFNNPLSDDPSPKKRTTPARQLGNHQIKSYYQSDGEFTKIKIYCLQSDDVIALRVSSRIGLKELSAKVAARFGNPSPASNPTDNTIPKPKFVLKYLATDPSDDMDTDFIDCDLSGDEQESASPRLPGKLTKFSNDEHLSNWMMTEDRLVIYI